MFLRPKQVPYGQPLPRTHPHLFAPGELTPGIPAQEYENRRRTLMGTLPPKSLVIALAAPVKYLSQNIFYQYRQASDFWYLTGFEEPDSAVFLEKTDSSRGYKMTFFATGSSPEREKWDGARIPLSELCELFTADEAYPTSEMTTYLRSVCRKGSSSPFRRDDARIYLDLQKHPAHSTNLKRLRSTRILSSISIAKYLSSSIGTEKEAWKTYEGFSAVLDAIGLDAGAVQPLSPIVSKLRSIKSEAEIRIMRRAAEISGRAHAKTMRFVEPNIPEATISAHFEYLCRREGAQRLAYVPVVASGANGLTIHYTYNNDTIMEDEMLLIDAGCEYNGYASDITRTYPSTGRFTEPQRDLYSAVLSAQKLLINFCSERHGCTVWDLHSRSVHLLRQELNQIGFSLQHSDMAELYPHFLSHPIGIDLHESEHFDRSGHMKAGTVLTVEPGVYVPPSSRYPRHFHNLAVRIEDEIVVGKEEPTILSVNAPKEIVDVEGACQGLLGLEAL